MSTFKVFDKRSVSKGTLAMTFDLALPSGLIVHSVMLHRHPGGKCWIGFPSKEWLNAGQRTFSPLIGFTDQATRERFQAQVVPLALEAFAEISR